MKGRVRESEVRRLLKCMMASKRDDERELEWGGGMIVEMSSFRRKSKL